MDKDGKLERLLRSYDVPPARGDLEERIISAASRLPQGESVWRWIFGVFEKFWSPVPAFCLALFLVIGFLAGVVNYGGADFYSTPDRVVEQLLDEDLL